MSTATTEAPEHLDDLPRWSVTDLYESLDSREFRAAVEQARADVGRAMATFDRHEIRAIEPRQATEQDGLAADAAIAALNDLGALLERLGSYVYATVSTDSRDERAQSLFAEVLTIDARIKPLVARLADLGERSARRQRWTRLASPPTARPRPSTPARCSASPLGPPTR